VIGLIAPRNINDSANDSVNRSGFAARSAGTLVVALAVCVAAASSARRNVGASFFPTPVSPNGRSIVVDGRNA
jgi:hypothetical protein|tara:strand:- start:8676 stop:8894 length:219 start_codon:yes stop_codon:yes gene_type:complete